MRDSTLVRLQQLAEDARRKAGEAETRELMAYWRGVLFGIETAIAQLQQKES